MRVGGHSLRFSCTLVGFELEKYSKTPGLCWADEEMLAKRSELVVLGTEKRNHRRSMQKYPQGIELGSNFGHFPSGQTDRSSVCPKLVVKGTKGFLHLGG